MGLFNKGSKTMDHISFMGKVVNAIQTGDKAELDKLFRNNRMKCGFCKKVVDVSTSVSGDGLNCPNCRAMWLRFESKNRLPAGWSVLLSRRTP